ncbi:ABC transporter [Streptomyces sp. FR-008]|nr:ABC transporter [Streptomyces sp. FR-008]
MPDAITVAEALELYGSFYRKPADQDELMELLGLGEQRKTRYKVLSGGQKQRLSIVLALVGGPKVAILDELTTGLDPQARRDTWSLVERVRETGVTVLLVTHFMDEAERLSDRIAVIDQGRVVAVDTPAGLIAQSSAVQQVRFRVSRPLDRGGADGAPRGDRGRGLRGAVGGHRQGAAAERRRRGARPGGGRGGGSPRRPADTG